MSYLCALIHNVMKHVPYEYCKGKRKFRLKCNQYKAVQRGQYILWIRCLLDRACWSFYPTVISALNCVFCLGLSIMGK